MEEHLASSESNVQSANHKKPVAIGDMTRQNLDEELQKGVDSLKNVGFTADEVDDLFNNAKSNS